MYKRKTLFFTGSFLFLSFIFFSYLVHKNLFTHFDFNVTVRLQDHISRRFDDFFSFLSLLGSFEVMSLVLLAIVIIKRKFLAGLITFLFFGMFHLIEVYGKTFVSHPPPPIFMLRTKTLISLPQFYVSAESSYPSGHSGRTMFVSTILIIFLLQNKSLPKHIIIPLLSVVILYDCVMLISRIYLGEHWTSDVIGGAILGSSFALLSSSLIRGQKKSFLKS